jgi:hypothetical protein
MNYFINNYQITVLTAESFCILLPSFRTAKKG